MTTSEQAAANTRNPASTIRSYLGNRWVLVVMATVAIVGGLALNWGWLVAIGLAPILIAVLPCLVMCGLGLCAHKLVGSAGASQPAQSQNAEPIAQSSASAQAGTITNSPLAGGSGCCGTATGAQSAADPRQTHTLDERRIPHA